MLAAADAAFVLVVDIHIIDCVMFLSDAQATIMLTPRFPLYLFGVYIAFLYLPTAMAWRLKLGPVAEAALAALLACCVYSPWDVVGARLIWWTWHDTDLLIANRLLGVPCASTVWQLSFCFCYSGVVRFGIGDVQGQNTRPLTVWCALRTFMAAQLLSVPMMLLVIQALLFTGGLLDGSFATHRVPAPVFHPVCDSSGVTKTRHQGDRQQLTNTRMPCND